MHNEASEGVSVGPAFTKVTAARVRVQAWALGNASVNILLSPIDSQNLFTRRWRLGIWMIHAVTKYTAPHATTAMSGGAW